MADPVRQYGPSPKISRRLQVEERLSAGGLQPVSGWWKSESLGGRGRAAPAASVQVVRQALEDLGGLFGAFGRYLASRADLLPVDACLHLSGLSERRSPTPLDQIQRLVLAEFGTDLEQVYTTFDPEPYRLDLFCQTHRALLNDERPVVVRLFHPDLEDLLGCDLEFLPLLEEVLHGPPWESLSVALEDFREDLRWQLDFRLQAQNLHRLAQDVQHFELLEVPTAYMDFSTAHLLTVERLPGRDLEGVIAGTDLTGLAPTSPTDLARDLCLAWLRQVLEGNLYPVEVSAANIIVLPGRRLAFGGGAFASLEVESQENVRQYLIAAAAQDPDKACDFLLREMRPAPGKGHGRLEELQQNFRQIVPFRDGSWSRLGASDSLAEHLFVHWRLVRQHGYLPRPHMVPFFRGLFSLVLCARQVAPGQDALREGLEDWRLTAGLDRFRKMVGLEQLGESADKYAAAALALPQQLERVLQQLNEGRLQVKVQPAGEEQERGQRNAGVVFLGLSALLLGLALWVGYLETVLDSLWIGWTGALLFIVLGVLLLRTIWRLR